MRRNIFRRRRDRAETTLTVSRDAGVFVRGDVVGLLGGDRCIVREVLSSTTLTVSYHWRFWRSVYWLRDNWPLLVLYATLALGLVVWIAAIRWWLR